MFIDSILTEAEKREIDQKALFSSNRKLSDLIDSHNIFYVNNLPFVGQLAESSKKSEKHELCLIIYWHIPVEGEKRNAYSNIKITLTTSI